MTLTIRKTGNLYQLRSAVGTIFQSHSLKEIEEYARTSGGYSFGSPSLSLRMKTDENRTAMKYGRLRTRP